MLKQKIILNENLVVCSPPFPIKTQVIRDNTFPNPAYDEALKYGRFSGGIPSEITTFHSRGEDLVLERGYARDFQRLCSNNSIELEVEEQLCCPSCPYPELKGVTLREYQKRAVKEAACSHQGLIVSPTGSGKSIMGLELIRQKGTTALILVHRQELAEQWRKNVIEKLGLQPGFIGGKSWKIGEEITIGMVQTLVRNPQKVHEMTDKFGLILCDECHHAPAKSFVQVIGSLRSKFRYGLSATPTRRDGLGCLIARVIGPKLTVIEREEVEGVRSIVPANVSIINTGFDPGAIANWHEFSSSLNHRARNDLVIGLIPEEKSSLILVDRIEHAKALSNAMTVRSIAHVLAHGQIPSEERASLMTRIRNYSITIGTTSLLGEGLDVAHWETLILAAPISSEAKLMQAIGRILRPAEGKKVGQVFDLKDDCGFAGSSLNNRIAIYKKHGINFRFNKEKR